MRERNDWTKSVHTVQARLRGARRGARVGARATPTRTACAAARVCRAARRTPASRRRTPTSTTRGRAACSTCARMRTSSASSSTDGKATGVEYTDAAGERHVGRGGRGRRRCRRAEHAAAPACARASAAPRSARHVGLHPVRLVYGLFDEPQDAHLAYPITTHCMDHQHDEDGGFVIEASTIQDPIGFATALEDENGPMWGEPLVEAVRQVPPLDRRARDGERREQRDRRGRRRRRALRGRRSTSGSRKRLDDSLAFSREVLLAAGAKQVLWSGIASTHVQGSCRMGDDAGAVGRRPERRDARGEAALRRRRLARPAHAVGEPVADDHGARDAPRRSPATRRGMKAALLRDYHQPLELIERPVPEPDDAARASSFASAAPASAPPICTRSRA